MEQQALTPTLPEQLAQALSGEYRIEREIGGGGMSRVFAARDLRLDRPVAIKVMNRDLAVELNRERFRREIEIAARLQHPNIVPVHTTGEVEGILYYTMPLISGRSLREELSGGPLRLGVATKVLGDTARALAAAHRDGIVHRDIKPENILLTDGIGVVTDFGIAKAVSAALPAATTSTLTQPGFTLGTPAYMAPEQVAGDPAVDHRADIYSAGCVAYEMLTGRAPFSGRAAHAVMTAHLVETPGSLAALRHDIPPDLERLVLAMLAKDPVARPQSAENIVVLLESSTQPAAVVEACRCGVSSIAVLPFAAAGEEQEYFADGLTEELLNALGHVPQLRVASRASAFAFKGTQATPQQIGEQLKVNAILEGSVRRSGERVRITARLSDTQSGFQIWSARFDRELRNVFEVEDEIAAAITRSLRGAVRTATGSAAERMSERPEAYDLLLRGRSQLAQGDRQGLERALESFKRAVAIDPGFALAWAGIAEAYAFLGDGYVAPSTIYREAEAAARRAVELNPYLGDAHASVAAVQANFGWDWSGARQALDEALRLNPSQPLAHLLYAMYWFFAGNIPRALAASQHAAELDPLNPLPRHVTVYTLALSGETETAVAEYRRSEHLLRDFAYAESAIGTALHYGGREAEALFEYERAEGFLGHLSPGRALALTTLGRADDARLHLETLESRWPDEYVAPELIAQGWAALGEEERALHWLETGVERRSSFAITAMWFPEFRPLQDHPRFQAVVEATGAARYARPPH